MVAGGTTVANDPSRLLCAVMFCIGSILGRKRNSRLLRRRTTCGVLTQPGAAWFPRLFINIKFRGNPFAKGGRGKL